MNLDSIIALIDDHKRCCIDDEAYDVCEDIIRALKGEVPEEEQVDCSPEDEFDTEDEFDYDYARRMIRMRTDACNQRMVFESPYHADVNARIESIWAEAHAKAEEILREAAKETFALAKSLGVSDRYAAESVCRQRFVSPAENNRFPFKMEMLEQLERLKMEELRHCKTYAEIDEKIDAWNVETQVDKIFDLVNNPASTFKDVHSVITWMSLMDPNGNYENVDVSNEFELIELGNTLFNWEIDAGDNLNLLHCCLCASETVRDARMDIRYDGQCHVCERVSFDL